MLIDTFEPLTRAALKGDRQALKQLFAEGEQLLANGNHADAAVFLKESAISYRIALFRERARTEQLEQQVRQLESKLIFKSKLLEKNWAGLQLVCPPDADLSFENIARVWRQLEWNDDLSAACDCLTELWLARGVRFSSPGGTVQRQIIGTVKSILESLRDYPERVPYRDRREELIVIEPIVRAIAALL